MLRFTIASALLGILCCQAALPGFDMRGSFDDVDADGNGVINETEFNYLAFDTNGDGMVNASEFVIAMQQTGMSVEEATYFFYRLDADDNLQFNKSEADGAFRSFDLNQDSFISFEEYSSLMNLVLSSTEIALSADPELQKMFDEANMDGDETLTQEELWSVFAVADGNDDKLVSGDEFVAFWRNKTGDSESNSRRWFAKLSGNSRILWGSDDNKKSLYNGFNAYEPEKGVTYTKFFNSLLYMFADVMEDRDVELVAPYLIQSSFDDEKAFKLADKNGDNRITFDEVDVAFKDDDTDDDDMLNVTEFIAANKQFGYKAAIYVLFSGDLDVDQKISHSEIRGFFHRADRDRNGSISLEEFQHTIGSQDYQFKLAANLAVKFSGMLDAADKNADDLFTAEELGSIFAPANLDDDQTLDEKEFVEFWMKRTGLDKRTSTYQFHAFDVNGNGLLGDGKESVVNFYLMDSDKDGKVSRDEFLYYMLYIQSLTLRQYETAVRTSMQGNYNYTKTFQGIDTNKDKNLSRAEFNAFFSSMDKDGDKKISEQEVLNGYKLLGMSREGAFFILFILDKNGDFALSREEIDADFSNLDIDDDDDVSIQEYQVAMNKLLYYMSEASMAGFHLGYVFDAADVNRDGKLTREDLKIKSGRVTYEEFKPYWMSRVGEPSDRTELMFDYLDADGDGYYGNDNEFALAFDALDFDGDNSVTKGEFLINMLRVFVRIILEQQPQA